MAPIFSKLNKHICIKIVCIIFCLIFIFLMMVWSRAYYGSMKAYQKGETLLGEEKYIKAITFFDRSIHWYTPFNPYIQRSAERLWEIGTLAEQKGDIYLALIAFRTIRRGFHAASGFYAPGKNWIKKCELKINELLIVKKGEKKTRGDFMPSAEKLSEIQKSKTPGIFWSIIVEVGFFGWIGSVIGFIIFALASNKEGKKSYLSGFRWIALGSVFYFLWIVGMMRA